MIAECLVVEFRVTGDECPLADASREAGAVVDARPPLRRADGNTLLQFSTEDPAVGEVLDADDRIHPLHQSRADGRYNYRCLSRHPCIVNDLVDVGFLVDSIHYDGGTERYVGAVVGRDVLEGVLAAAGETGGIHLERISRLDDSDDEPVAKRWDLTPAQEEAVRAAIESGYFEVPRAATADEVAAQLDISKSAFLERLRRAEGSLLRQIIG